MPECSLSWTEAPALEAGRDSDPLGFSTLHESAANVVLPFLTGRTSRATDYVWVLVGLRWAGQRADQDGAGTQQDIWRGFERFEKALKIFWEWNEVPYSGGTRAIRGRLEALRNWTQPGDPLVFQLLQDQRSQGLLGAYGTSLRAAGLVEDFTLTGAGLRLIEEIELRWNGQFSGMGPLSKVFNRAARLIEGTSRSDRPTSAVKELGRALFEPSVADGDDPVPALAMREVAAAIARDRSAKPAWARIATKLTGPRREVAKSAAALDRLVAAAHARFWAAMTSAPLAAKSLDAGRLSATAWHEAVFGRDSMQALGLAFAAFARSCQTKPDAALRTLHLEVWKARQRNDPWFQLRDGKPVPRVALRSRQAPVNPSGLRWRICRRLIRETRWAP